MSINIQFLGAAGCVTGSQFLVTVGERRVLVDCGMFQGSPTEIERNRLPFAFDTDALDAVVLTHAHLDHCGRLPALVKAGFRGPIHATHATADLAEIVLRDSAKLQVEFTERWNRRHAREAEKRPRRPRPRPSSRRPTIETLPERLRKTPPEGKTETRQPLYDEHDVETTMQLFRGADYDTEIAVTDGVSAVLHDAGHILGSAIVELRVADAGETRTIVFSGDLGRDGSPILRDPTPISARRSRRRRVDLWQSRARATRRGDRGAGARRSAEVERRQGRDAGPRVRHRSHPGADLGARRPRARRTHPPRAALSRFADGVARDAGLPRPSRDVRRGHGRAAALG